MRRGASPTRLVRLAIGAILVLALVVYAAFAKRAPFVHGYRIDAVFTSSNQLREGAPVRIAGVTVGHVAGFADGPGVTRTVRLELDDQARPLHADSTAKIRPRLFLEGGFYVQLSPGSPSAPVLGDGGTIPVTRTAVPVQLNDVLSALPSETRASGRSLLRELDVALAGGGAEALRASARPLVPALRDTALTASAAQGTGPHDLADALQSASRVTAALASRDGELARLIGDLDVATGALAAEQRPLAASIVALDDVMRDAPAQLAIVDGALPSLQRLTTALRPGLRLAPGVLRGVAALLDQLRAAARPAELPALLRAAAPALRTLPGFERRLRALLGAVTPVTDCVRDRVAPVLEAKLDDGRLSTDRPVWQDLVHALTNAAGTTGFDGNGDWLRLLGVYGERSVSLGTTLPSGEHLTGIAPLPISGTRPRPLPPGKLPPLRADKACREQPAPDLRAATGPAPVQQPARARRATVTPAGLRRALRALARQGRGR